MPTQDPDQWWAVSPYLDEALDMTDAQRSTWLAAIQTRNPTLAGQLQALLAEHKSLSADGFLERECVPLPSGPSLTGHIIGPYRLQSQLGQGGMGSVWLAERHDGRFERRVAVKFLNIALMGKAGEGRFKREGRILGRLAHPNIAKLLDAGVASSGQPYLVLEYVEGEHIDHYCDHRKMDIVSRVRLFIDVLASVAHAHTSLIVHRDIKPSNVLVAFDGEVKLLDFSIAKLLEEETDFGTPTALTVEGARAMTPEYAAPEQLKGEAVTTAADVYALGVLLYVLLTGQHPAGPGSHAPADLVSSIVSKEPPRPSEVVSRTGEFTEMIMKNAAKRNANPERLRRLLEGDLDTIIAKALKKERTERYASVTAFADDLLHYLRSEPIGARPDAAIYRAAKFIRRNRTAVVLAVLAVIATVAGLIGTMMQSRAARLQRDFALRQVESSEVLNEFHQFLLSDAAPSGKPFTVNELLDRATHIVERQHATKDPDRLRLLISIGYQYLEQDEAGRARPVLEEAYRLSRESTDVSIRAKAACILGTSAAQDDELSRAEALFHEGIRELPESPQFALERISCLRSGTEIAVQSGNAAEAVTRALKAQSVLRQSRFDSEQLELERSIDLATAYSAAGQDEEAVSAFERASRLLSLLGRDQTENAAVMYCNWGLELDLLGRPLDAENMYELAMSIERAGNAGDEVSPIVLANYARTLEELGRLQEAADYATRAYSKAQRIGYSLAVDFSLFELARINVALNNTSRATSLLDMAEVRLQKRFPAGHYGFAILASQRALIALERGDLATAMAFADRAVIVDEAAIKSGGDGSHDLPRLLTTQSKIELAASHFDMAATAATRAISLLQFQIKPGTFSRTLGYAYLALGQSLRAQGKTDEARSAFRSAVDNLKNTIGATHPDTLSTRHLADL